VIAVIGCGNPTRSDDGVAAEVLRLLAPRAPADTKLLDAGTDGVAVMFAARGCRRLVVVDACRTGAEPGAVFEVPGAELADDGGPALATHDFRWDHALAAGRRIYRDDFPDDVTVFLIEAHSLGFGIGLSAPVAASAHIVADRIAGLIA
jgi:hydrogenase maturation protease